MAELKRQLGLLDATMINVGTIIASAIFIVPSAIALQLHASLPTILVWIAGGLVSLLGALSVAELGAAMPQAGGQYVYLTKAYGPVWGYLYGWASGVVGVRRLDRDHVRRERGQGSGAQRAALDRAVHAHRNGAVLSRDRLVRLRAVPRQDGGVVARRLGRGPGDPGPGRCRARRRGDSDRYVGLEQRNRAHGSAHPLCDGAGPRSAALAGGGSP